MSHDLQRGSSAGPLVWSPSPAASGTGRRVRTVGVEEELLLVDAETLHPVPVAEEIIERARGMLPTVGTELQREVKREQIEVVSPPLLSLDELRVAIAAGRRAAEDAAATAGAHVVALATAPLACATHRVSTPRYDRMQAAFGLTMDEQLTCGFHVHVGVASPDEGVAVLDRIRPWLPVLLALSANSPFWQGVDTQFASYRYQAWGRWPTAGPYDRFGSLESYRASVAQLLAADVSFDTGMVYFDARLSDHVPTVEVRIADVCLLADHAAAVAALVRALVETAATEWRAGERADDVPTALLRLASWRASRFAVSDALVHPVTRRLCPAREAVAALLEHVDAGFPSDAERGEVARLVADILDGGGGAMRQRQAMAVRSLREDVIADAVLRTHSVDHTLRGDARAFAPAPGEAD
jgi:carboxylate-amine ligase